MLATVSPAFAEAELAYRHQQIASEFAVRRIGTVRRAPRRSVFTGWRRPRPLQPAPAAVRPSPHHAVSRG